MSMIAYMHACWHLPAVASAAAAPTPPKLGAASPAQPSSRDVATVSRNAALSTTNTSRSSETDDELIRPA